MSVWRHPLLRTLVWALLLAGMVVPALSRHAASLLPVLDAQLSWMDDHYRTVSLVITPRSGELVILWTVQQVRSIVVGEHVAMPHPLGRAEASTLLVHLWGPACLLWAWLLGHTDWRQRRVGALLGRLSWGAGATLLMVALDVPMVLWAAIWSFHAQGMSPDGFSPLLWWAALMDGGGRWALALGLSLSICPPQPLRGASVRSAHRPDGEAEAGSR